MNILTSIPSLIVKLERRLNTQNLENVIIYLNSIVNVTIKSEKYL